MDDMAAMRAELDLLRQHCDVQDGELQRLQQRRNVTLMPYRERKLRKYSGVEPYEDWEVDAQAAITGSGMSPGEQAEFLYNKLEGNARREVVCRGGHTELTVEQLFSALGEVFTKRGVVPRLLSKFWARDQAPGESLASYSHTLMAILEDIFHADPREVPDQSALLLKKFCAGVADSNLRWELKQQLRSDPTSTFLELRATALRWAEECAPREEAAAKSTTTVAAAANVTSPETSQLHAIQGTLEKLQATLEQQGTAIQALQKEASGQATARAAQPSLCFYCRQPGHFSRECQQRMKDTAKNGPPARFPGRPRQ